MAKQEQNFKSEVNITFQAKSKKQADYIMYRLSEEMKKNNRKLFDIIEECKNEN